MKTIRTLFFLLLFFIGIISSDLYAQSNLEAIAKKCETRDDIKMTFVQSSKQNKVVEITFSNIPSLRDEILSAFNKDRNDAETIIEEKDKGRVSQLFYTFQEEHSKTDYIYDQSKSGKITFTIIQSPKKK